MPNVFRILDANANRAREALRVMEEAARFLLNNRDLSQELKQLRHDLVEALSVLPSLEAHRDTPGDVGTAIKVEHETRGKSVGQVVEAAGKRLSEALRAIEEYAKTLGVAAVGIPEKIEALRYRGYGLEQALRAALGSGRARQWRLCLLVSQDQCRDGDWWSVVRAAVEPRAGQPGVDCIQLREKTLDAREILGRTEKLVAFCRPRGVSVIVNDRPDIALLAGADGVHLGQDDLPCCEVRKWVGRQLIIGVSTSTLEQVDHAIRDGADYCGLGPMFPSATKHKPSIAGPKYAAEFLQAHPTVAHLAIGGIEDRNIPQLLGIGVRGIAVCRAVCASPDPGAAVVALLGKFRMTPHAEKTVYVRPSLER